MTPTIAAQEMAAARMNGTYDVTWRMLQPKPDGLSDSQRTIIALIEQQGELNTRQIIDRSGLTRGRVENAMRGLKSKGIAVSVPRKHGRSIHAFWSLVE